MNAFPAVPVLKNVRQKLSMRETANTKSTQMHVWSVVHAKQHVLPEQSLLNNLYNRNSCSSWNFIRCAAVFLFPFTGTCCHSLLRVTSHLMQDIMEDSVKFPAIFSGTVSTFSGSVPASPEQRQLPLLRAAPFPASVPVPELL